MIGRVEMDAFPAENSVAVITGGSFIEVQRLAADFATHVQTLHTCVAPSKRRVPRIITRTGAAHDPGAEITFESPMAMGMGNQVHAAKFTDRSILFTHHLNALFTGVHIPLRRVMMNTLLA